MRAYLLAAGRGKRAGGPKAWLEHEGKTLLERQLDFILSRFAPKDAAVSVQGSWLEPSSATWRMMRAPAGRGVSFIAVNPDASPLASLQALLRARPATAPFFVWHVDQPVWDGALFDALERRIPTVVDHSRYAAEAVRPVQEGKAGHPVLLIPELSFKILALDPISERLDSFLRDRQMIDLPVSCPSCVQNWNEGVPA